MNKTEICNMALARVGTTVITNVDTESSLEAVTCRVFFDIARDQVLESMDWNFARKRLELEQDAEAPVSDFSYRYPIPADCIKVRSAYGDITYEIDAGFLLTDEDDDVIIRYTFRQTDVSKFSPNFCNALAILLAANIAPRLAADSSLRLALLKELQLFLAQAQTMDAREGNDTAKQGSTFWTAEGR